MRWKERLRRDPVLYAAAMLAAVSAFFVPPSPAYFSYLDLRVLALLLALMLVVAGLKDAGAFGWLTERLLERAHTERTLAAVLVGICFFGSMLITNDVALITFVPLTLMLLPRAGMQRLLIPVIVLQTIAANLGSSLTPLGNPQNLYLYSLSGMSVGEFLRVMAPAAALSLLLLTAAVLRLRPRPLSAGTETGRTRVQGSKAALWLGLFGLCLLAVLRAVPCWAALAAVLAAALLLNRKLLRQADCALLGTFVFLFIFIGNIKSIPAISDALSPLVAGREVAAGILLSQVVSNVPAAMLLSGFTTHYAPLLLGVNLGGLGTLIASMASMISYKLYAGTEGAGIGRYLGVFTLLNLLFLGVLRAGTGLLSAL